MRTIGRLATVIILAGCGRDTMDSSVPASTHPTTVREDCANGADDDGDGLLDCEDEDCATASSCIESECDDSTDNDDDGLVDCEDEDCWGPACERTIAVLEDVDTLHTVDWWILVGPNGAYSCDPFPDTSYAELTLVHPRGVVRHFPAYGGAWETCDWSAQTSGVRYIDVASTYSVVTQPVHRSGFAIDADCTLQDSAFLPAFWTIDDRAAHTGPAGDGPAWWRESDAPTGTGTATGTGTGTGGECTTSLIDLDVVPGQPYRP